MHAFVTEAFLFDPETYQGSSFSVNFRTEVVYTLISDRFSRNGLLLFLYWPIFSSYKK